MEGKIGEVIGAGGVDKATFWVGCLFLGLGSRLLAPKPPLISGFVLFFYMVAQVLGILKRPHPTSP